MADSFADLWKSTAPSTTSTLQDKKKLGSIPPRYQQPAPKHDAFSLLASSSSSPNHNSAPTSRSITPASTSAIQTSGRGDAFGDLLSLSGVTPNANTNMTIAERQRILQQRQASSSKFTSNTLGVKDNMGQWKGLDSLVAASSTTSGTTPLVNHDDDWGLGDFASVSATKTTPEPKPAAGTELLWDVDDFTSPDPSQPRSNASHSAANRSTPQLNKASQPAEAKTLWDLEEFISPSSSSVHPPSSSTKTKTIETTFDSPENDFDFGSREDQDFKEHRPKQDYPWSDATTSFSNHNHIHEQDGDEDDILGLLSKPVDEVVTKQVCVCFLSPYCWLTRPLLGSNNTPRVYICKRSVLTFIILPFHLFSMYRIVHFPYLSPLPAVHLTN